MFLLKMYRYLSASTLLFHNHEFILSQFAVPIIQKLMVYDKWK